MKYAAEMDLGAMIYIPSFRKIGSGIRKFPQTYKQQGDLISLLLFFQNKEGGLK
jgi:hypothetical protein